MHLVNPLLALWRMLLLAAFAYPAMAVEDSLHQTLIVAAQTSECVGVGPQECLQVKQADSERFELFYDAIEGFDYQPGYEYRIEVSITPVANPPADASSRHYRLVKVISKIAADRSLEGTVWLLRHIADVPPLPEDARITLQLENGQISGNSGCNRYRGSFEMDGEKLQIAPGSGGLATTLMACPDEMMQAERHYVGALAQVSNFQLNGDQLLLNSAEQQPLLRFQAELPLTLTSTEWQLRSYNNQRGGLVSTRNTGSITASFDADGKVNGSAGCNRYFASYQLEGEKLTLSAVGTTRKICPSPEGVMKDEQGFLRSLSTTSAYRIHDRELRLLDDQGVATAVFVASPQ